MRRSLLVGVGLCGLAAAAGAQASFQVVPDDPWCTREDGDHDRKAWACEVREATVPAAAGTLVVDAGPNGAVAAKGSARHDVLVRVKVVAHGDSEAQAREMLAAVSVSAASPFRAQGPASRQGSWWSASFDLGVPERSDLKLTTVNGPVAVASVAGRLELDTQNGPLSVVDAAGAVRGRTANGPLTAKLTGTEWKGQGLDLETTNGPVSLSIPEGYDAQLETGTVNGPINLGFALTISGDVKRDIRTTLGKGGALVRVRTTNGPLNLRRP